jgi:hypothetical protein
MGDEDTAAGAAQREDNTAYEVATGEHIDDHTFSAGITIRPGSGVESVRVRVPGMDEFETGPEQLREWLQTHGLVHTPQQWTELDQQLQDAIQGRSHAGAHHHGPGDGAYQWEDFGIRHNQPGLTESEREAVDEEQTAAWTRMLHAWEQFQQQVADLSSLASSDEAEPVIRQVGHTITALNMIENNDWTSPYTEEFSAWEMLSTDGLDQEHLHTAVITITDAGHALYNHWHDAIDAGDYDSYGLTQAQHEFVTHCTQAREALHH